MGRFGGNENDQDSDVGRVFGIDSHNAPALARDSGDLLMNNMIQAKLERLYKLYPRKMGKARGMKMARGMFRKGLRLDEFETAISNYTKHILESKTENQFIMYFSTFVNQWQEWLDPEHGKVTLARGEPKLDPGAFE